MRLHKGLFRSKSRQALLEEVAPKVASKIEKLIFHPGGGLTQKKAEKIVSHLRKVDSKFVEPKNVILVNNPIEGFLVNILINLGNPTIRTQSHHWGSEVPWKTPIHHKTDEFEYHVSRLFDGLPGKYSRRLDYVENLTRSYYRQLMDRPDTLIYRLCVLLEKYKDKLPNVHVIEKEIESLKLLLDLDNSSSLIRVSKREAIAQLQRLATMPDTKNRIIKKIRSYMVDLASEEMFDLPIDKEHKSMFFDILKYVGYTWDYDDLCVISQKPIEVNMSDDNEFVDGVAIEYLNEKIYTRGTVVLPEQYAVQDPMDWDPQWLLSERNAEVRRILIEALGVDKVFGELGSSLVNVYNHKVENKELPYELYHITTAGDPVAFLRMTCPSTAKTHIQQVPPNILTAEEAATWMNQGIHPGKFAVER